MDIKQLVKSQGFALIDSVLSPNECAEAIKFCMPLEPRRGGVRNLMSSSWVKEISEHTIIREAIKKVLGEGAFPYKAILFDKSPISNWKVPWHQDISLQV